MNEPRPCYGIRNNETGTYIHWTLFRRAEFYSEREAINYMKHNGISQRFYYVEVKRE